MHISQQADPVDRVSLALSCKELLAASQLRTLEVPHPMAHRAPWSADPAWRYTDPESVKPECQCGGLEKLLRQIRPKNPKGHADRTLHLCVDCLKYLPRRKSWWLAKREELGVNAYYGEVIFDWDHAAHNFSTGIRMQCPKCRLQEHGDLIGVETKRLFDFEDENPEFSQLLARLNRQVPDVAQPH